MEQNPYAAPRSTAEEDEVGVPQQPTIELSNVEPPKGNDGTRILFRFFITTVLFFLTIFVVMLILA